MESNDRTCGYDISREDGATLEALNRLLDILRRLRHTGAETRAWTRQTLAHLQEKLKALDEVKEPGTGIAILSDLVAWEGHILQVIRNYMQEVSETVLRIKTLNPPLTAEQLRPFIQAAEDDRTQTIQSLVPLTAIVEELGRRKNQRTASHSRVA
jgi:hypothetical protein